MGLGGLLFAVFAGQPLVIVGVTGPVCILVATIADLAARWDLPLRGWLLASCFWAAAFHALLALVSAPRAFAGSVTAFSGDVFGALIGVIYVVQGATTLIEPFVQVQGSDNLTVATPTAVLALCLGCGCALLAACLSQCGGKPCLTFSLLSKLSRLLPRSVANALAAYAMPLAVIVATAARFAPAWADAAVGLPLLPVVPPQNNFWSALGGAAIQEAVTLPAWAAAAAALPGAVLTALLFFDHNVSALLTQAPHFPLRKPPSYDFDFFLLGVSLILTGFLGLPPNYGLLPQAPMHTEALSTMESGVIVRVCENRISNTLQAALLLSLLSPPLMQVLGQVPQGALGGVFLYLGVAALAGNGAVARLVRVARGNRRRAVVVVAGLQVVLVCCIFGVTLSEGGLVFPVLIMGLLPLRRYVLPYALGKEELESEDPVDWGRGKGQGVAVSIVLE